MVSWTSKMFESKWYNMCKKHNTVSPNIQFAETIPPRWTSKIPGANMMGNQRYGDNNWVTVEKLADGKTFVGTTDTQIKVKMDIETLDA